MDNKIDTHTALVKSLATSLGFSYCGIARAEKLEEDGRRLEAWLSKGLHGKMHYMENHFDLRIDPTRLVPGAKSVITLLFNYFPSAAQKEDRSFVVSKYAYGDDYHEVIRPKLRQLLASLQQEIGQIEGRGFVDSAPVLERSWALRSGLGWIGKNGNIIHKGAGSYFFIATLITDLELNYDEPYAKDYCGSCTRCIDACPTDAILPDKVVDGSRCISYFTIELKELLIPDTFKGQFENRMFGCDICQDVCPWNRFSTAHAHEELKPRKEILTYSDKEWIELTEENFRKIFKGSPLKRAGFKGIMRNITFLRS